MVSDSKSKGKNQVYVFIISSKLNKKYILEEKTQEKKELRLLAVGQTAALPQLNGSNTRAACGLWIP